MRKVDPRAIFRSDSDCPNKYGCGSGKEYLNSFNAVAPEINGPMGV